MWNGKMQRGSLPPKWLEHAKADEKQRLAVIEGRLNLKKATIDEALAERKLIMQRCVRRMRRKEGKE
jgi:hypothetical protein